MTEKRKPYTIQLTPGADDDLINAIKGITEGQRNQALKDALRVGLGLENAPPDQMGMTTLAEAVTRIEYQLSTLPGWFKTELSRLSIVPGGKSEDGPRLSPEDQERLKAKMKKAAW
jgi:hypothetical protein